MFQRLKIPRAPASFLVCSLALLAIYGSLFGAYTQISVLLEDLPAYTQRINELTDKVLIEIEAAERTVYQVVVPKRLREQELRAQPQTNTVRRRGAPALPAAPPLLLPVQEVRIKAERSPIFDYLYAHMDDFC